MGPPFLPPSFFRRDGGLSSRGEGRGGEAKEGLRWWPPAWGGWVVGGGLGGCNGPGGAAALRGESKTSSAGAALTLPGVPPLLQRWRVGRPPKFPSA